MAEDSRIAQNNALKEWMGENGVWVFDRSDWGVGPHALSVAVSVLVVFIHMTGEPNTDGWGTGGRGVGWGGAQTPGISTKSGRSTSVIRWPGKHGRKGQRKCCGAGWWCTKVERVRVVWYTECVRTPHARPSHQASADYLSSLVFFFFC